MLEIEHLEMDDIPAWLKIDTSFRQHISAAKNQGRFGNNEYAIYRNGYNLTQDELVNMLDCSCRTIVEFESNTHDRYGIKIWCKLKFFYRKLFKAQIYTYPNKKILKDFYKFRKNNSVYFTIEILNDIHEFFKNIQEVKRCLKATY